MLKIFKKFQNDVVAETQNLDAIEMLAKFTEEEDERRKKAEIFLEHSANFISSASQYIWGISENEELEVGNVLLIKHQFMTEEKQALLDREGELFWNAVKSVAEATQWLSDEVERIASERKAISEQIELTNSIIGQTQTIFKVKPVATEKKEDNQGQEELDIEQLEAAFAQ